MPFSTYGDGHSPMGWSEKGKENYPDKHTLHPPSPHIRTNCKPNIQSPIARLFQPPACVDTYIYTNTLLFLFISCLFGVYSICPRVTWAQSAQGRVDKWESPPNRHHINGLYPFSIGWIQETTGHRSLKALRQYERVSQEQERSVSHIRLGAISSKPPFAAVTISHVEVPVQPTPKTAFSSLFSPLANCQVNVQYFSSYVQHTEAKGDYGLLYTSV